MAAAFPPYAAKSLTEWQELAREKAAFEQQRKKHGEANAEGRRLRGWGTSDCLTFLADLKIFVGNLEWAP